MRVIFGKAKGKTLKALPGMDTRPTADRVKEAIFGSLQFELAGAQILDVFAGSGALGIEALSRGASRCVFIEKNAQAMSVVKQNAVAAGVAGESVFIEDDFNSALLRLSEKFDFIFLDPPYASDYYEKAISAIDACGLLKRGGKLICEHDRPLPALPEGLKELKNKKYGRTYVTYCVCKDLEQ